jgi:hypothetical protein
MTSQDSKESASRLLWFMDSWANLVLALGFAAACLGFLIMSFFSIVSADGRYVTIPAACLCIYLAIRRGKALRMRLGGAQAMAAGQQNSSFDPAQLTPNKALERTRDG